MSGRFKRAPRICPGCGAHHVAIRLMCSRCRAPATGYKDHTVKLGGRVDAQTLRTRAEREARIRAHCERIQRRLQS